MISKTKTLSNTNTEGSYLIEKLPLRRGPLITLSKLWSAVSYTNPEKDSLPELHEIFMDYFRHILREDEWLNLSYDIDGSSERLNRIEAGHDDLNSLNIGELRDLITWIDRLESNSQGTIAEYMRLGLLQKILNRFCGLIWPKLTTPSSCQNKKQYIFNRSTVMENRQSEHSYKSEALPKRRGPLTTLAYLWAVVPVSRAEATELVSNQELPEPHQTFIATFKEIMERDDWLITNIDQQRWANSLFILLNDPDTLKKLSVMELRDILTYFYNLDGSWGSEGILDQLTRTGQLQKVLLRLSNLISAELYE